MTMREAIARYVPDGASAALGLALEPFIPFAAGHESFASVGAASC